MKKSLIVLSAVLFLMAGCDSKKESLKTCKLTSTDTTSGYKMDSEYKIYSNGDVVSKVVTIETVETDNEKTLNYFKDYLEKAYSSMDEKYHGYSNNVEIDDNKLISTTTIDYSKMDLDAYVKDNSAMKNYVNNKNQLTTSGIIKVYEALGAICE